MSSLTRLTGILLVAAIAGFGNGVPIQSVLAARWGSGYGDPPGFCTNHSGLPGSYGVLVTNDPLVGSNPEQDTFYGFYPNPGYDDWYGYFYGDFRGRAGDSSGWTYLTHDDYPAHSHWNFSNFRWAVHGHAKQYIAYYNWTFGGECGIGAYRGSSPPPFMADQFGTPVLDIYVDSTPPDLPQPRVVGADANSLGFSWDPVVDRGDGAGADYFAVGLDHYSSWLTIDAGLPYQYAETPLPRTLSVTGLTAAQTVCVHVKASDGLGNTTAEAVRCAQPAGAPPAPPAPPVPGAVKAAPPERGLAGLSTWLWIDPAPTTVTTELTHNGYRYRVAAEPTGAAWDFGDGSTLVGAFGIPYPAPSTVRHTYDGWTLGVPITATIQYRLQWWVLSSGRWVGPYPMGAQEAPATPLIYPVRQAQPELGSG